MTPRRSYRNALDLDYTKKEIEKCSGSQFDPTIAKIFLDILEHEPDKIKEIQASYQDD